MEAHRAGPAAKIGAPGQAEIAKHLEGVVRTKDLHIEPESHHYIVLSMLYAWMQKEALPVANGVMLDYGCGGQPYRGLFEPKVSKYISADVAVAADTQLDILLEPNKPVPLPAASIDTVLANQTLEHVSDADFYLHECNRVLRPGGVLILTAPMQWRHHEVPYDFFRFTRYGIIELLVRNGFEIVSMTPTGGVYCLLGQIFLNHLSERGINRKFLFRCINRLALWLDRKIPDAEDTINWMCIARNGTEAQRITEKSGRGTQDH